MPPADRRGAESNILRRGPGVTSQDEVVSLTGDPNKTNFVMLGLARQYFETTGK